jgi:hypothetical protein
MVCFNCERRFVDGLGFKLCNECSGALCKATACAWNWNGFSCDCLTGVGLLEVCRRMKFQLRGPQYRDVKFLGSSRNRVGRF